MTTSGTTRSVFGLAIAALLSACASGGVKAPPAPGSTSGPAAPAGKPLHRVSDVLGKSAGELDARFGAPALIRREGAGEFRRYTLSTCSLIVILYPNDKGEKTAGYADAAAKTADAAKPDLNACLAKG